MGLNPSAFRPYDLVPDGDRLYICTYLGLYVYDGEHLRPSESSGGLDLRVLEKFGDSWVLTGSYVPSGTAISCAPIDDTSSVKVTNHVIIASDDILKERDTQEWWKRTIYMSSPEMCVSAKCFRGRLYLGTHHADGRVLVLPVVREGTLESAARRVDSAGKYELWWNAATPLGTAVAFQLRFASTEAELDGKPFVGPDGTKDSFYTAQGSAFSTTKQGFLQYRAKLTTDNPARSPYVKRVVITRAER